MTPEQQARAVAGDPDALAAWDVGVLDLPEATETALAALLSASRSGRDWHQPNDVTVLDAG